MAKRLTADRHALRRIREENWLNQDELAEKAGLAEQTVTRIETGRTPHPTRSTIRKLAKVLDVHPSELVLDEPNEDGSAPLGDARGFYLSQGALYPVS